MDNAVQRTLLAPWPQVYDSELRGGGDGRSHMICSSGRRFKLHTSLVVCVALVACSSTPKRKPVPPELYGQAEWLKGKAIRAYGEEPSQEFLEDMVSAGNAMREERTRYLDANGEISVLALSGGGSDGAFSAGLLNGWTASGTRPVFVQVTGVSTGALIAPMAFLGEAYDEALKDAYTNVTSKDIYAERSTLDVVTGTDAVADSTPLQRIIEKQIGPKEIEAIATEHRRGRRLYIGTTNMDARRFVVWNIGAIANTDHPDRLTLVRKILLASASIPIMFPPVYFDVTANGETYDEMHGDGGVVSHVFFTGLLFSVPQVLAGLEDDQDIAPLNLYVVRNGQLRHHYQPIEEPSLGPIAATTISTMIRAQGLGDLLRIYLLTKDQLNYRLAYIPHDFTPRSEGQFDKDEMNRLYQLGYHLAKDGYKWQAGFPQLERSQ